MSPAYGWGQGMTGPVPWLERARVVNYRSIERADVGFGPLTVLIGPNAAGKSNFLDAIWFLTDAVATTPYEAVDVRGGLGEILRRVPEPQDTLRVEVDVVVPWGPSTDQWARGSYGFELGRSHRRGQRPLEVVRETCELTWRDRREGFTVERGHVSHHGAPSDGSVLEPDRLYLPTASALPNLAPLYRQLRSMAFYDLDVVALRRPEPEAEGSRLTALGRHLPDVLGQLAAEARPAKQRLDDYLTAIVPGIRGIDRQYAGGGYVAVEARQQTSAGEVMFSGDSLSEGTIRAAGVLAALFQPWVLNGQLSLVGIEEPELALHPAAAGVLFDALTEASERVQVIATSQSADLLDRDDLGRAAVRAVAGRDGLTVIGSLDEMNLQVLGEGRLTLGELMRANQVSPGQVA
jgi:predicted ATPase